VAAKSADRSVVIVGSGRRYRALRATQTVGSGFCRTPRRIVSPVGFGRLARPTVVVVAIPHERSCASGVLGREQTRPATSTGGRAQGVHPQPLRCRHQTHNGRSPEHDQNTRAGSLRAQTLRPLAMSVFSSTVTASPHWTDELAIAIAADSSPSSNRVSRVVPQLWSRWNPHSMLQRSLARRAVLVRLRSCSPRNARALKRDGRDCRIIDLDKRSCNLRSSGWV
jgi:hypothetical protein